MIPGRLGWCQEEGEVLTRHQAEAGAPTPAEESPAQLLSCHLPWGSVSLPGVTAQELLCALAAPTQGVVLSPPAEPSMGKG